MENIDNLLNNKDFIKELMKLSTIDEVTDFFNDKGIELNANDAKTLLSGLSELSLSETIEEIEISEDELLSVAGGARKSFAQYILEQLKKKNKKKSYGGGGGGGYGF